VCGRRELSWVVGFAEEGEMRISLRSRTAGGRWMKARTLLALAA
jgi:hypothetical protein